MRGPGRLAGGLAALVLAACGPAEPLPGAAAPPAATPAAESVPLGSGFVVWESNRSGAWRIWLRDLAGGEPRRLSPDEPGRQHCCPRIAPGGRAVAYLSSEWDRPRYPEGGLLGELRLLDLASGEERTVAPQARSTFEDRAVVWRSDDELIHLDGDGATHLLELPTGDSAELLPPPARLPGWLIDPTLSWATHNDPSFSPYDRETRSVAPRPGLGGCQAVFSHDGRWGVWTGGAGGPIYRIELATRAIAPLLEKRDPRVPDGYGYLYFPLPAHDGRLLAFAGSRGDHDHFTADYEVFVVETDPATLEPLGAARRLTFDPSTDRYPDAWLAPSPLGDHRGEAPLRVDLDTGEPGSWRWELGDGSTAEGARVEHLYPDPGRFEVTARDGQRNLRGRVMVVPRRAPGLLAAIPRQGGAEVELRFDEAVRATAPRFRFESQREAADWTLSQDGRTLRIAVAPPLVGGDVLHVEGFEDRAQRPNTLPPTRLEIPPAAWPTRSDALAFLWATGDALNLVPGSDGAAARSVLLRPTGRARLDRHSAMVPDGGRFDAEPAIAATVVAAVKESNALTLEMTVRPEGALAGPLLALGRVQGRPALELHLREGRLALRLATAPRGPGLDRWVELFALSTDEATQLALTYRPGRLVVYRDGEAIRDETGVTGDFFAWKEGPMVFGGEGTGALEGIALWSAELSAETIAEDARRYRDELARRPEAPGTDAELRLERCSEVPSLREISPYREALVVCEHTALSGERSGERLRVVHWALLDGELLPLPRASAGSTFHLRLELFADQPQLASLYLSDTLGGGGDRPLLFAPEADPVPLP